MRTTQKKHSNTFRNVCVCVEDLMQTDLTGDTNIEDRTSVLAFEEVHVFTKPPHALPVSTPLRKLPFCSKDACQLRK
jgi:hypothetical protein